MATYPRETGQTPKDEELIKALLDSSFVLSMQLLEQGASANARALEYPFMTALHIAVQKADIGTIIFLLQHDAEVDATDANGYTAAHFAALSGA